MANGCLSELNRMLAMKKMMATMMSSRAYWRLL